MSDTIFQQTPVEPTSPNPQESIPQEVQDLVGEGKKYASVNEALKSVPHAQSHISKLEAELQSMREELDNRKTAQQLLDDLQSQSPTGTTPPASVDPDTVSRIVAAELAKRDARQTSQTNIQTVITSFNEHFGDEDKAQAAYLQLAKDSGLSIENLNKLAATAPSAVMKLAGLDKVTAPPPAKIQNSVNTEGFKGNPQEISARVPKGGRTRDLVNAWRNAGLKVKQQSQA